jgi:hypothetical protein
MRSFVIVVASCLACALAPAHMANATPACPSPDSIRAAVNSVPPERNHPAAGPTPNGQFRVSIRENWNRNRYSAFVVDSQYVARADQWAADSAKSNPLRDFPVGEIAAIYALKGESVPDRWRTCPGVPVFLILTKSRSWRPPPSAANRPSEWIDVRAVRP